MTTTPSAPLVHFRTASSYTDAVCGIQPLSYTRDPRKTTCPECHAAMAEVMAMALGLEFEEDYTMGGSDELSDDLPAKVIEYRWVDRSASRDCEEFYNDISHPMVGTDVEIFRDGMQSSKTDFESKGQASLHFLRFLRDRLNAVLGENGE